MFYPKLNSSLAIAFMGKKLDAYPNNLDIANIEPEYTVVKGWNTETSNIRSYDNLPAEAKELIKIVEAFAKVAVGVVSVGADHDTTIIRHPNLVLPKRALGAAAQG